MPYKYVGRTHDFKGKSLWEILGNLKNLGVGRIVIRNRTQRYPEPCYMKILKVETLPVPENESCDNSRLVRVLVEKTFRGQTFPKPVLIEKASYKTDYVLIPKDQEANICKNTQGVISEKILPRTMEFPPLLKELIIKENASKESPSREILELEIAYNKCSLRNKMFRVAEKGETPTETISTGLGTPASPNLYKGVL